MGKFAIVILVIIAMSAIVSPAFSDIVLAQYDIFSDTGTWSAEQFLHIVRPDYTLDSIAAQTFIPTVTGTVSSIQVPVTKTTTSTISMSWAIRSTYWYPTIGAMADLTPAGLLSSGTLSNSDCPSSLVGWTTVQMSPVELLAGQSYALVASAVGTNDVYRWWTKHGSTTVGYSDGRALSGYITQGLGGATGDIGFRVNAVPEPSSVVALLSGIIGFAGFLRRRA